ncbi:sensor histidine kinase [Rugamonas aquatica]|uniref:histidine kinase n=1 Tax=Rugamonas aquatica TaxID=2743357 RepID=A0A6A7MU80_9BURK|nr:ATP-binding protein [Rugamonas aquatica]MQA36672.1 two-component sensor histidine kinase [Rugamonas aquatica]
MDGRQKHLKDSLQLRLSLWLTGGILAVAVPAAALSFVAAYDEANELQDDTLRHVHALFDQHRLVATPLRAADSNPFAGGDETRVVVQLLPSQPVQAPDQRTADEPLQQLAALPDGIHRRTIAGTPYRILLQRLSTGERLAVAQAAAVRDEIALEGALRTLLPLLVLLPLLPLLVVLMLRRGFRPIATLAGDIDRRSEHELQPLTPDFLPSEMRPFVTAINRLLERVAQAMQAQRRFVADAAHELRSPMTALSLQAEALADSDLSPAAQAKVATLRSGLRRGRDLLEQLLSLARVQASPAPAAERVSLLHVFRLVLEDLMPLAQARNIDLGVTSDIDAAPLASEVDLLLMVRNLVDNAIRHTPDGGRVDLAVLTGAEGISVEVCDSGPGIAPEERERVFDPFYRALGNAHTGSGLGLSIVAAVARRLGARVTLDYVDRQVPAGLRASILFSR